MDKTQKEQVVAKLTEQLKATEAIIVADYRGLTNSQLVGLRSALRQHGAKLQVVKNTLSRRAAEAAGTESLLALLEGPSAIAFIETEGDAVAVAKALSDVARETKILSLRGGVLSGKSMSGADVEELAKLPPADVIKSQLVGVIVAPLTQLLALLQAPVQDLVGLLDARIKQLDEGGAASAPAETEGSAEPEPAGEEPSAEVEADASAEGPAAVEPTPEEPAQEEPAAEATAEEPVAEAEAETTETD
ncbi:MAG: 50S ribosomal protein L10 [Gaiellales bacterium]